MLTPNTARLTTWAIAPHIFPSVMEASRRLERDPALRAVMEAKLADARPHVARLARTHGGRPAGAVAVIDLQGLITPRGSLLAALFGIPSGLEAFRASLREAVADPEMHGILLNIDSPGGLVDLVPETAADVRAASEQKPVIAVSNTLAASAAYWIGAQATEFVVTPSGEAGSIGVFSAHEDWSKFDEKLGVKTTLISAGRYKTEANPYEPLSESAEAHMQETVDDLYDLFVDDVARGRKSSVEAVRRGYGEGRVLSAARAVEAGLADRVATFEETVASMFAPPPQGGSYESRTWTVVAPGATITTTSANEVPEVPEVPEPEPEPEPEDDVAATQEARRKAIDLIFG